MLKNLLPISALLGISFFSQAQLAVDSTFGTHGYFSAPTFKAVLSVDIQPDKKVVMACSTSAENAYIVWRLRENGTTDSTFNKIGYITGTDIRTPRKVVALPDSSILLMGTGYVSISGGFTTRIKLLKLTSKGIPDASFGINGWVVFSGSSNGNEDAYDMQVAADGKITVVGTTNTASSNHLDYLVLQYNADGTPNQAFNPATPGYKVFTLGDPTFTQTLYSLAIQEDGKLVVGGSKPNTSDYDFDLVCFRLTATGDLDNTFNSTGYYTVDMGGENVDVANDIEIQQDGKIVLVANTGGWAVNKLIRLNANGTRDNSYSYKGPDGIEYLAPFGTGFIVSGSSFISKINADGSLDKSVGTAGVWSIQLGSFVSLATLTTQGDTLYVAGEYYGSAYQGVVLRIQSRSLPTDIQEGVVLQSGWSIYPNPFQEELTIQGTGNGTAQVTVFDSEGKAILSKTALHGSITLQEIKQPGLYLVQWQEGSQVTQWKVVKK